jgi:predicted DCC family thiol-disulfide oxidoreductase YuxK
MKMLTWLDWFHRLTLRPLSDPEAAALVPHLSREDLLEAIHCVSRDGTIYRAARALRFVGMRLPALVPMALLLWVPGVIFLAERAYDFVSARRLFFSRVFGCRGACAIMPERSREGDELPARTGAAESE